MLGKQKMTIVGVSVAAILSVGFVMQHFSTLEAYSKPVNKARTEPVVLLQSGVLPTQSKPAESALRVTSITPTAAPAEAVPAVAVAETPVPRQPQAATPGMPGSEIAEALAACPVEINSRPRPAAMIEVSLSAPCFANERVTLHHSGLMFTEVTGADGSLTVNVPAMAVNAAVIAEFDGGGSGVTRVQMPAVKLYARSVIQWSGESGLELHAREYGSDYGGEGHVWEDAKRSPRAVAGGEGGFLTVLGNAEVPGARRAQVYTFPIAAARVNGGISISVEAEISQANCGRQLEAQSLQTKPGGGLNVSVLSLDLPGCDAAGDFLVFDGLVSDLEVARNQP